MRTKDRDDYRGMTDRELVLELQEALDKNINYRDLALVLTERLRAAKEEKKHDQD
jgi:hypothetical protein